MQTWCLTSTETVRLIRDGEKGEGVWWWGEREIIYLSLHCHHQNDFCIKMGSDESHFNVSVGSDGQSHKTVSTNHNPRRVNRPALNSSVVSTDFAEITLAHLTAAVAPTAVHGPTIVQDPNTQMVKKNAYNMTIKNMCEIAGV